MIKFNSKLVYSIMSLTALSALAASAAHAQDRCSVARKMRSHFIVTRMAMDNFLDHPEQRAQTCQDVIYQQRDVLKGDLRLMADFNNKVYDHRSKESDDFAFDIHTLYLRLDDLVGRDDLPKSLTSLCKLVGSGSDAEIRAEAARIKGQISDLGAEQDKSGAGNRLAIRECTEQGAPENRHDGARDGKKVENQQGNKGPLSPASKISIIPANRSLDDNGGKTDAN